MIYDFSAIKKKNKKKTEKVREGGMKKRNEKKSHKIVKMIPMEVDGNKAG